MFLIIAFVCLIIALFYYQRVRRMTILERCDIPGPKPHLIFGNMSDYNTIGYNECFDKWKAKYGSVFGYYLGAKPFIVVTDPELLKLIQIKDFQHFSHRPYIIPGGIYRNWKYHQMVARVESFRWKKMRTIMSPWFSSSQLKANVPVIKICVEEMLAKIDKFAENNEEFNIYEILEGLTMDTVDRSSFSIHTDIQNNFEKNPLIEATRGVFSIKPNQFFASLLLCLPEFSLIINILRDFNELLCDYFGHTSHGLLLKAGQTILKNRLEANDKLINNRDNNRRDILQLMIDSRNDKNTNNKSITALNEKSFSDEEIVANIILLHEAGYESPLNILGFIIHNLINYPDIQQKCFEEINELYNKEHDFNYNVLTDLSLTEAVVNETFRLFPVDTMFISRSPDIDYKFRSFLIPKGVDIRVPIFQLHRDEKLWSEPLRFEPARFLNKEASMDSVIFQPFGVGPRICPGKRFGILEIKLTLAKILHKYKIVAGTRTELGDIELDFKLITVSPKNGVSVKLIPRHL